MMIFSAKMQLMSESFRNPRRLLIARTGVTGSTGFSGKLASVGGQSMRLWIGRTLFIWSLTSLFSVALCGWLASHEWTTLACASRWLELHYVVGGCGLSLSILRVWGELGSKLVLCGFLYWVLVSQRSVWCLCFVCLFFGHCCEVTTNYLVFLFVLAVDLSIAIFPFHVSRLW